MLVALLVATFAATAAAQEPATPALGSLEPGAADHTAAGVVCATADPPDLKGAIRGFRAACRVAPGQANTYANLGVSYMRAGNANLGEEGLAQWYGRSKQAFAHAVALAPRKRGHADGLRQLRRNVELALHRDLDQLPPATEPLPGVPSAAAPAATAVRAAAAAAMPAATAVRVAAVAGVAAPATVQGEGGGNPWAWLRLARAWSQEELLAWADARAEELQTVSAHSTVLGRALGMRGLRGWCRGAERVACRAMPGRVVSSSRRLVVSRLSLHRRQLSPPDAVCTRCSCNLYPPRPIPAL